MAEDNNAVSVVHKEYEAYVEVWEEMRDHLAGSRKIKEKGEAYLPMLGSPKIPSEVLEYEAYKDRALYYEATKRTKEAMLGAMLMKDPQYINLEDKYTDLFTQVTMDGFSMKTFIRNVLSELCGMSRTGVLVERAKAEDGGSLYFVQYKAEDIINWRFQRVNDKIVLTLIVLREKFVESDGRFGMKEITRYRVLELVDSKYQQSLFIQTIDEEKNVSYIEGEEIIPVNVGEQLDFIPFVFFTPMGNVPTISDPVLSSIACINLSHYRSSADLEHGRHFTGLPTAWVAGFNDVEQQLKIGSMVAWVSDNPGASAGFLEFTGQGLGALVTALEEKQEQMATMGARMLRPPRTGVEAAETAKIYQSAESGSLASIAGAASESFTTLIHYWLIWQGVKDPEAIVEINTDYIDTRIDSATLTALMNLWLSGGISYDTLFYNMQQGEVMPEGADLETERGLIELEGPKGAVPPDGEFTE